MKLKLIGISGTNGAGKDTVGELLAKQHNYLFVSGSDMLRDEARRRNLPVEREVLSMISAEWRREYNLGILIDKCVDFYNAQKGEFAGLVIASLRNPGEADRVHELGGRVVWVDADPKIRYNRIFSRQRSAEDSKTFEQFVAEEKAEMTHSGDEATLNMAAVKDRADLTLINDGGDIEQLNQIIENDLIKS